MITIIQLHLCSKASPNLSEHAQSIGGINWRASVKVAEVGKDKLGSKESQSACLLPEHV